MRQLSFMFLLMSYQIVSSQVPCVDGKADIYDCDGVDLMAIVSPDELGAEAIGERRINDLWGWTDPLTGKEYALVGMVNGTSFVDISDPVNPVVLGVLKEHNWDLSSQRENNLLHDGAKSVWRDIKVYQNYAYIVSEDYNHGLQVFDLTDLRDVGEIPTDFQEAGHYNGIGQAHNIHINEATGFLYAVGFTQNDRNCASGGLHIISLADPKNPVFAGCFDESGYIHDTQCVIYEGPDADYYGKEICFNSNATETANTITITDVTEKGDEEMIAKVGYTGSFYAHQGWLTENHRYFISNDELDEFYTGNKTKTFIWDVRDLEKPELIGSYTHDTKAIDHNLYVKGNRVYQSNYTNGLRILEATNVRKGALEETMFFDVHPESDNTEFLGTWSNYPFFKSGIVIVSDFTRGLFILDPTEDFALSADLEGEMVTVFPNPTTDKIKIKLGDSWRKVSCELVGIDGKVLIKQDLVSELTTLSLEGYNPGIYLLRVKTGDGESTHRITLR